MAHGRPDLLQRLVTINARAVASYLNEQIVAGVDAVMIFDTWGGLLSTDAYRSLSLSSMRAVLHALAPSPEGGNAFRRSFSPKAADSGSTRSPRAAHRASASTGPWISRRRGGALVRKSRSRAISIHGCCLPIVGVVRREAAAIVRAAGPAPGHIFNLGHGIVPATPPENVAALVEAVHGYPAKPAPGLDLRERP